jgi:chloride channel 3/4/5
VQGLHGVVLRLWEGAKPWLVVVLIGVLTGAVASCLDILSAWLSDLRLGGCRDMWWMSRGLCCAGLDRAFPTFPLFFRRYRANLVSCAADETCRAWRTWGEIAGDESHIVVRALTQYGVYILLAVRFSFFSYDFLSHRYFCRSSSPSPPPSSSKSSLPSPSTRESPKSRPFSAAT